MRPAEADTGDLVDALVEDERWHGIDIEMLANRACAATIRHVGSDPGGFEIGLLACDDQRIVELNSRFRNQEKFTNVLAWPVKKRRLDSESNSAYGGSEPESLGDIAISWDACRHEAEEAGKRMGDHVTHLVVHSCLHLLGYRHMCEEDAREMEQLETEVLASLGVSDPYGN